MSKKPRNAAPPLHLQGFEEYDAGGSGSCGYNSIAVGASLARGGAPPKDAAACHTMGQTLDQHVKQHIEKHSRDYQPRCCRDPSWNETTEAGAVPSTWEKWLQSLFRNGRSKWLCGETVQVASTRLGVNITILPGKGKEALPIVYIHGGRSNVPTTVLVLRDQHYTYYTVVLPDKAKPWPQEWLSTLRVSTTSPARAPTRRRTGYQRSPPPTEAHTPTHSSARCVPSWLPAATPSASSRPALAPTL